MNSAIKRLLLLGPTLFGVSVLVFLLLRLIPGDPAQVIMGLRATPEGLAAITRDLGLDLPLHDQYFRWVAPCCMAISAGTTVPTSRFPPCSRPACR